MKILQLRFKNLNSLVGEWAIDFTASEYQVDGIFAITGPTGAGKSTILDAICLALYGKTPRLDKVNKSSNEIMSRQTGECFAEIIFSTQTGTFSCHWGQHRARKKAGARLADQRHEIADVSTGQIIESKKSNVPKAVAEVTGMDFQQFTRSILLAQGGFDTFLKAAGDKRSPILEQITGTEIYSTISQRVHERWRGEREKLLLLEQAWGSISLLTDEEEVVLHEEMAQAMEAEKNHRAQLLTITNSLAWYKQMESLEKELTLIAGEEKSLQLREEAFAPRQLRRENGLKAMGVEGAYAHLSLLRSEQATDQSTLERHRLGQRPMEESLQGQEEVVQGVEQTLQNLKLREAEQQPLWQRVRALDLQCAEGGRQVALGATHLAERSAECALVKTRLDEALTRRLAEEEKLKAIEMYRKTHSVDELLVQSLAGWEEQIRQLAKVRAEGATVEKNLAQAKRKSEAERKKVAQARSVHAKLKLSYLKVSQELAQSRATLVEKLAGRLLREYRADYESLYKEIAYLQKIASLEAERDRLVDGMPCLLCGALHHPFASGSVPRISAEENSLASLKTVIDQIEGLEAEIEKKEVQERQEQEALRCAEQALVQLEHSLQKMVEELERQHGRREEMAAVFLAGKEKILVALAPLGLEVLPQDLAKLVDHLQTRQREWLANESARRLEEEKRQKSALEITSLQAQLRSCQEQSLRAENLLAEARRENEKLTLCRENLYGKSDPDLEEKKLFEARESREQEALLHRKKRDLLLRQLAELKTTCSLLLERVDLRAEKLLVAEDVFRKGLDQASFVDEPSFLAMRLAPEELETLNVQAQILQKERVELRARKQQRRVQLEEERARSLTTLLPMELESLVREEELKVQEAGEKRGALKQRLADNGVALARMAEQKVHLDGQKRECQRWDHLHELIGSADGKKYRDFAQGLTFELMVHQANRQLVKMTDRYLLVRHADQPLELQVVDNYQAGELRSTKNLSGGESFIVSLALALGLSSMASRRVRVDSLFLDEGFGTLDDDALEVALETLAGLQQEDKLIGVISHVGALKERIATQIQVRPISGGRSAIQGPGCRLL